MIFQVEPKDHINWKWNKFKTVFKKNLLFAFYLLLPLGFMIGLLSSIITGSSTSLVYGIILGFFMALSVGLTTGLVLGIIRQIREDNRPIIQISFPLQRFICSTRVLNFSIIQHWHIRYLLSKQGLLPYKVIDFLNDMVKCNILETTGAFWRFRHRILQDYFVAQWKGLEPELEKKNEAQK